MGLKLNAGYQVTSGVVLRPILQYIVHPDPIHTPPIHRTFPTPFVIGLQVNADVAALFHSPRISHWIESLTIPAEGERSSGRAQYPYFVAA